MRRSREEAAQTRQRIIEAASQRFRENGIAETGLNDLMKAAGLETQGGFYKHFESKDELIEEAIGSGVADPGQARGLSQRNFSRGHFRSDGFELPVS